MKFGVIVFPGSNCDWDAYWAVRSALGEDVAFVWHKEETLPADLDCLILPGGFSYGDYLRSGAIARFSPIMNAVIRFARAGGLIMGICNGFQILCEIGLLPGAFLRNRCLRFLCCTVFVRVERSDTPFTNTLRSGAVLRIPIAHGEGNYYVPPDMLRGLEQHGQVLFRYCDAQGRVTESANPNGSVANIAGVVNREGNVLGLMPHPERACDPLLGNADGLSIFQAIRHFCSAERPILMVT
ncbi:MAG: phosphoribosylformylglycinamidine synthase subunit PurQ [Candidatus Kapabacteria bacterium]|nr:phosphoribosylformylglycinamidine synthase subunit PurQ [Candidatus Kapabacteria bacterium]MCS7169019.1 phosphoribosylformylglycinamidine synthase subunit PurQ [Candidatus Kapabacteria bacterium]MDW7997120.1 phosphoribosylformylglycinamidine synthase subunit PurQ [Bacteroidota bacterium]MDW8225765.1 phosphoribosylformylglycinamidine synthase subunit PurQ [Bacteroidota bacterium]